MKIAVTYDTTNGTVFQHFGKSKCFKLYEVENGAITADSLLDPNGVGHEALADLLKSEDVDILICGGLGGGAMAALADAGIEVFSGAEGSADDTVKAYLAGELDNAGVNCDHEEEAEEEEGRGCGCGDDEEGCGGCGGGCGGCGGGCGGPRPVILEGKNAGKTVKVHYRGTFNDGTQFDASYDRGEPMEFICGTGMMIEGFDKAVVNMEVGETVNIHLMPAEAYGERDESAVMEFPIEELGGAAALEVGARVGLVDNYGRQFPVTVIAKDDKTIKLDANHEMAGKELNFQIELISAE